MKAKSVQKVPAKEEIKATNKRRGMGNARRMRHDLLRWKRHSYATLQVVEERLRNTAEELAAYVEDHPNWIAALQVEVSNVFKSRSDPSFPVSWSFGPRPPFALPNVRGSVNWRPE